MKNKTFHPFPFPLGRPWSWIFLLGILSFSTDTVDHGYPSHFRKAKADRILGADISFLPELEARGMKFYNHGTEEDAIQILREYGFNYIRLRIFNDPASDSGYSPKKGFCNLSHCKAMALRIRAAGLKFLLDFQYSDYWADPGKQFKPRAWKNLDFTGLQDAVHGFTKEVLTALKEQGTSPDMVQVGNEINHGMIWPDGDISHPDTLAALIRAGIAAIKEVDPSIQVMLHIASGGQNAESRHFLDQMISRDVRFDLIGESYYPQWHGTLEQLDSNLRDLSVRYPQDIIVVEYSMHKKEVNDIVFHLPGNKGRGSFIWEPLNTWESVFNRTGKMKDSLMRIYKDLSKQYRIKGG
jgi:arabinogalactan endo-1,4-beta-galactosidase